MLKVVKGVFFQLSHLGPVVRVSLESVLSTVINAHCTFQKATSRNGHMCVEWEKASVMTE